MKNVHPSSKSFDLPEIFQHISKGTAFTFKGNTLCFLFVHILTIALQVVCECLQASSIQTTSLWTISPSDSKQLPATTFRKDRWLLEVTGLSLSLYDLVLRLILFWEADFFMCWCYYSKRIMLDIHWENCKTVFWSFMLSHLPCLGFLYSTTYWNCLYVISTNSPNI